ncbi:uncharacterized protein BO87DRAFT_317870 [Aspergillus neoniger CBS 115656]|uniref:Uncharacterized protein n=1 Tax=Aspergillus neoniger (strain CBS 115656) TaxID=1448310 RepID=A0A318Y9U5_ASPNB|nr:hypothetical protein BO87DRAFT_317870 [Aspergillus neoniger CBS 115656]PYH30347.1 hypothetical protein BO87DRAFT_317870 [Aspergillus neoniger CBS 115656]
MYYLPLTIDFCNSLEATRLFQVRDKILTYTPVAESSTHSIFWRDFNLGADRCKKLEVAKLVSICLVDNAGRTCRAFVCPMRRSGIPYMIRANTVPPLCFRGFQHCRSSSENQPSDLRTQWTLRPGRPRGACSPMNHMNQLAALLMLVGDTVSGWYGRRSRMNYYSRDSEERRPSILTLFPTKYRK